MKQFTYRVTYVAEFTVKAEDEDQASDLASNHASSGESWVSNDDPCESFSVELEEVELTDTEDLDEPLFDLGISFIQHPENTPNMGVVHFEDGDKRYFLRYYVLSPSNLEFVGGKEAVAA
jgi:hypothetical protein